MGQQPGKGKEAVMEEFDDAAFERAFEQARGEIAEEEEEREQARTGESMTGVQQVEESDLADLQRRMGEAAQGISDPVLADDRLQKEQLENLAHVAETQGQQEEPRAEGQDDDALAATAQELLEKVEHNQTEKFRNSQFLGLMRKLRDREVKVRGEEMVETVSTTSTTSITGTSTSMNIPNHVAEAQAEAFLKPAPPLSSQPLSPHDSGFESGGTTPSSTLADGWHFDTHICGVPGCDVDHAWDHWESPVVH